MTKDINEREVALAILLEVEKGEKSHLVLRQVLEKYQYISKQERSFLTRLVEGTIERRIELDYIINQFSKVKTNKMKPVIRNIMRMAVYQIKYMDAVPNSAACNEAVNLAVRKGFKNLRGFVNGVVRNIERNIDAVNYPDTKNTIKYLSVVHSMPEWIVEMWIQDYGVEQTTSILESFYLERPTTIRVDETKTTTEELCKNLREAGVTVEKHPAIESALMISGYDYLGALESFRNGEFQVQDASSIQVAESADIKEGDYVIDVCAAPGGKALHAAQLLNGTGHVEARDLTLYKVGLIENNIERMGFANVEARQWDALVMDEESREKADVVIADLPCSGLGVMAKKTDLRYKMTKEMEEELATLQREILSVVHNYVKPGGTLIYSTCTICKNENEENARWFGETFTEFEMKWGKQIFPSRDSDGFYIAKFKRREK